MTPETKIELTIGIAIVVGVSGILSFKSCGVRTPRQAARHNAAPTVNGVGLVVAEPAARPGPKPPPPSELPAVPAPASGKPREAAAAVPRPEPPPRPEPVPAKPELAPWQKLFSDGRTLVLQDKLYEAWPHLTQALMSAPEGPPRDQIKALLRKVSHEMVLSPRPMPDSVTHVVQANESYWKLSQKYNVTQDLIKWTNQKSRNVLRLRERLKILRGKFSALVQKSRFRLIVFFNNKFVREYPVGIGKYDKTPVGTFVIQTKLVDPKWYGPDGVYPFGHAKNILGTRWLGFKETAEFHGYGIHGCNDPSAIGKMLSNGCIRMRNPDVEDVYKLLRRGDEVTIVR